MPDKDTAIKLFRLVVITGSSISAFFAPLFKLFGYISPKYLNWTGAPPGPDKVSILANMLFYGVLVAFACAFSGIFVCFAIMFTSTLIGKVLPLVEQSVVKAMPFLFVLVPAATLAWILHGWLSAGPLLIMPIREFDLFRLGMAIIGLQAYFFLVAWLIPSGLLKIPILSPDDSDIEFYVAKDTKAAVSMAAGALILVDLLLTLVGAIFWKSSGDVTLWLCCIAQLLSSIAILSEQFSRSMLKAAPS